MKRGSYISFLLVRWTQLQMGTSHKAQEVPSFRMKSCPVLSRFTSLKMGYNPAVYPARTLIIFVWVFSLMSLCAKFLQDRSCRQELDSFRGWRIAVSTLAHAVMYLCRCSSPGLLVLVLKHQIGLSLVPCYQRRSSFWRGVDKVVPQLHTIWSLSNKDNRSPDPINFSNFYPNIVCWSAAIASMAATKIQSIIDRVTMRHWFTMLLQLWWHCNSHMANYRTCTLSDNVQR